MATVYYFVYNNIDILLKKSRKGKAFVNRLLGIHIIKHISTEDMRKQNTCKIILIAIGLITKDHKGVEKKPLKLCTAGSSATSSTGYEGS